MHNDNDLPLLRNADISSGQKVLVRVDFNVPVDKDEVRSDFRIKRSLETIDFLREKGAKVILMSHITDVDTLEPVSHYLKDFIPHIFIEDLYDEKDRSALDGLENGEVALLENLRRNSGEKENNEDFSRDLADLADVYVNDAFAVSHREHASVVGVPKLMKGCAGFLIEEEVKELSRAIDPKHPFLFILGGAKFETKMPLIERFLDIADTLLVGGALANDLYKAEGLGIGQSLTSKAVDLEKVFTDPKVLTPKEVIVERDGEAHKINVQDVREEDIISDVSAEWIRTLEEKMADSETILWNGPFGNYEAGYSEGSEMIAKLIAESNAHSIVGGGDTLAIIGNLGISDKLGFISTGGGAMLDFLANGTLPGIEVLK
ncbi:MAG: phosphoglycerate kinase [Candidatus Campbellbacteria bacterium]|nr:phosphoglycerate kinase [Candidatus Campbellbacteria bacterium]